jgi:hypothetical protein
MRTLLLTVHISGGTLALLTGPFAMFLPKRPGWHPRAGRSYQICVGLVCVTAIGLAIMQPDLWWLGVIAVATWAAALTGWRLARRKPAAWLPWHVSMMGTSYISLVTALLVVNLGVRAVVAWLLPTIVGTPLTARAAYRAATRTVAEDAAHSAAGSPGSAAAGCRPGRIPCESWRTRASCRSTAAGKRT